jgi:hypothetical protein
MIRKLSSLKNWFDRKAWQEDARKLGITILSAAIVALLFQQQPVAAEIGIVIGLVTWVIGLVRKPAKSQFKRFRKGRATIVSNNDDA